MSIKIYTLYDKFIFSSEQIILFCILDKLEIEPLHCYNDKNEGRYNGIVEFCKKNINY